jgi:alanine racemase
MTARVRAEIDIAAIKYNMAAIRAFVGPKTDVMAVVKANAYGHGLEIVSQAAWDSGARCYGVTAIEEGASVRRLLPEAGICLLSPFLPGEDEGIVQNRLTPFISSLEQAERLSVECSRRSVSLEVHLEIDTGMGRSGLPPESALEAAGRIAALPGIRITGLATHFACGDSDPDFTRKQNQSLMRVLEELRRRGIRPEVIHDANSGALSTTPETFNSLVRPGLFLYGIRPKSLEPSSFRQLKPVLALKTRVALLKELPEGHAISYDRTHILTRPSLVATLPVGYGDGYPRELSNRGSVLIRGFRAPILGRVCMDMTVVDVTDLPGATVGDEAVLIGRQGSDEITVEQLAALINTTEHDITTRLTDRVARIPVHQG